MSKNNDRELLSFSNGNAKLPKSILTVSLPAGFSCPGAHKCMARADPDTGKISDGKHAEFRCFSASNEVIYPNVRESRWRNLRLLNQARTVEGMTDLINASLPKLAFAVRIHVSGDFFNQDYFDAWMAVARLRPQTKFYAYTKSLTYWAARKSDIPANMRLVASRGGKFDHLIDEHGFPEARVFMHPEEAEALGVEIDHDDSLAMDPNVQVVGLLLHGTQPKGSEASATIKRLKAENVKFSYSR
jgi:hypothetical protein